MARFRREWSCRRGVFSPEAGRQSGFVCCAARPPGAFPALARRRRRDRLSPLRVRLPGFSRRKPSVPAARICLQAEPWVPGLRPPRTLTAAPGLV